MLTQMCVEELKRFVPGIHRFFRSIVCARWVGKGMADAWVDMNAVVDTICAQSVFKSVYILDWNRCVLITKDAKDWPVDGSEALLVGYKLAVVNDGGIKLFAGKS